jgi:hydrogenase maturation factor
MSGKSSTASDPGNARAKHSGHRGTSKEGRAANPVLPSIPDGHFNGFDLFLRFADGCRHYLDDRGTVSMEDSSEIRAYLEERGARPTDDLINRVYHVAYPGLQKVCSRLKAGSIFERRVVREFYAFDHNRRKHEQGNLICMAYPARVMSVMEVSKPGVASRAVISMEPLTGMFTMDCDFPLKPGDWVIIHRMRIIEKVDKAFADMLIAFLRKLGFDKSRKFPRRSYKYFLDLKCSSDKMHLNNR